MSATNKKYIAVICNDQEGQKKIYDELKSSGCEILAFSKINDILEQNLLYVGFVVELKTLIKSSLGEKQLLSDLEHSMDFIVLRATIRNDSVYGVLTTTESFHANNQLESFRDLCHIRNGKKIRQQDRKNAYISLSWKLKNTEDEWKKSFTGNISKGGIFLINADNSTLHNGDEILIKFPETENDFLIQGKICWKNEWGSSFGHPLGLGIEFIAGIEEFLKFYNKKMKGKTPKD